MIVSRRELVLAIGLFILLTLVFTWPVPLHLGNRIPVSPPPTDAMHLLYALTWSAQSLGENPFRLFHATFFYPYNAPLAFLDHMVGMAMLIAPVNWTSGSMFTGFDVAWLLTFVLSGVGAYLLVRYLTDSRAAAVLAGILFAFHPFRYHNAGQINVLAMMWVPFALLSLHLWVETRLRRELFLFVAFSLLQFLSSAYSGVFLLFAVALYLAVLLVMERRPLLELLAAQRWIILAVAALSLVVLVPFTAPYLRNARADVGFERSLGEAALFSARPLDFLTPAPQSVLAGLAPWGAQARHPLFPGLVACLLGLFWVVRRGWRGHVHRPEFVFYVVLAGAAALLALGPTVGDPSRRIPGPFALAWYVLPGTSFIRAPVRFVVLASLGIAVLAGAGLGRLAREDRPGRQRRLLPYLLAALAGVELYAAPVALLSPLPGGIPGVYRWLGSVKGDIAIAELPMPADESREAVEHARYQLYSLVHRKRLADGIAAYVPPITRKLRREMQRFPDNASVAMLRELGITYVLVHSDQYPPGERERLRAAIDAHPGLTFADASESIWVVDVVPAPAGRAGPAGEAGPATGQALR